MKNPVAEARNSYTYTAGGNRLSTIYRWNPTPSTSAVAGSPVTASALTETKRIDYVANKVYENEALKRILIEGGYYDVTASKYYFYIQDHLGSNRIVADNTGAVIQSNQYYPFGSTLGESSGALQQPYKYTGKELDMEQGLNLYDYHARQYDPAIGRFTTMDPLSERYYSISPYAYCANNPINAVDLRGDSVWYTIDDNIITMNVTAKLINFSSYNINMEKSAKKIASGISNSFDGDFIIEGKKYHLKTAIQLDVVKTMNEVNDSDHLFVLANKIENAPIPGRGITSEIGGKVMTIYAGDYPSGNLFANFSLMANTRTAVHEFGHALGLNHETNNTNNLMYQGRSGEKITGGQRLQIFNHRNNINRGTNYINQYGKKLPNPYAKVSERKGFKLIQQTYHIKQAGLIHK